MSACKPEPRRTPLYWVVRIADSYYGGRTNRWAFCLHTARRFHHRTSAVVVADQVSGRVVAVVPRRSKPSVDVAARKVVEWAGRYYRCRACDGAGGAHLSICPIAALAAALGEA